GPNFPNFVKLNLTRSHGIREKVISLAKRQLLVQFERSVRAAMSLFDLAMIIENFPGDLVGLSGRKIAKENVAASIQKIAENERLIAAIVKEPQHCQLTKAYGIQERVIALANNLFQKQSRSVLELGDGLKRSPPFRR